VVAEAKQTLTKFYGALNAAGVQGRAVEGEGEPDPAIVAALSDDLNLPKARYVLNKLAGAVSRAEDADEKRQAAATCAHRRACSGCSGRIRRHGCRSSRAASDQRRARITGTLECSDGRRAQGHLRPGTYRGLHR
jgi:cysteinyl-tRNA synthetase